MTGTYEMIRALPGKPTNWTALNAALQARYLGLYGAKHNGAQPWPGNTTDAWDAAKGVRQMRFAAMMIAGCAVDVACKRSRFIPPSPETLSWGGFLGGERVSWTDKEAEADEINAIADIIREFA